MLLFTDCLNSVESLDGFLQRFALSDKWEHAALAVVNLLSLFQRLLSAFLEDDHDAVFIGYDIIARAAPSRPRITILHSHVLSEL